MYWIYFSLLSVFTLSVSNILQRVLMKDDKSDPLLYSIVFQFVCAGMTGLFALERGFVMPPISQLPFNFLLMAMLYGLGTLFIFKSLQHLEVSEITILSSTRLLVTIISAVVLLHEPFGIWKMWGAALIILAVVLVTDMQKGFKFNKGIIYILLMSLCFGLAITNDTFILKYTTDVISYTAVAFLLPGLFLLLLKPQVMTNIPLLLRPKPFRNMFIMCLFYSVAAIAFYTAIATGGNASQVGPINQASVIVTVVLAIIFLHEKQSLVKKLIASVLVFGGVFLLK